MVIVDSQVHLWSASTPEHPWPAEDRGNPQRAVPLEPLEMFDLMDRAGVDRAVIVPPIWAGDDNLRAEQWSSQYPDRLRVMGRFDLWERTEGDLENWLERPGMLGIRLSFPRWRGTKWLDLDEFPWFWANAERLGIPVMVFVQGVAPLLPIARRHPGLRLIVDHLGLLSLRLRDGSTDPVDPFARFDDLLELAECPNVFAKFSSLPVYSTEEFPYRGMLPYLRQAYDAFGSDRLMWGSDASRLRGSYEECLDHVRSLEFLSEEDREWILGRTVISALQWR